MAVSVSQAPESVVMDSKSHSVTLSDETTLDVDSNQ